MYTANAKILTLGTQHSLYSIGSRWGFVLGVTQLFCFALGVLPNGTPNARSFGLHVGETHQDLSKVGNRVLIQIVGFCVAVEYWLNSYFSLKNVNPHSHSDALWFP